MRRAGKKLRQCSTSRNGDLVFSSVRSAMFIVTPHVVGESSSVGAKYSGRWTNGRLSHFAPTELNI